MVMPVAHREKYIFPTTRWRAMMCYLTIILKASATNYSDVFMFAVAGYGF
jgi:hypothetical protein